MKKIQQILAHEVDPAFAKRADFIIRQIQRSHAATVLDAGCGRGFYVKLVTMIPTVKSVVGIDISPEYARRAKNLVKGSRKARVQIGSIYELPFPDESFDTVICSEILEHLDKDVEALKEVHRVLKPQGMVLISVPHQRFPFFWDPLNWLLMRFFGTHVRSDIWWLAGVWADHVRLYSPESLKRAAKKAGFTVSYQTQYVHWCWPFTHFALYAIGKNIVERFGRNQFKGAGSFDRFNFQKNSPFTRFVARLVALPSDMLDQKFPKKASMNLVMKAVKQ